MFIEDLLQYRYIISALHKVSVNSVVSSSKIRPFVNLWSDVANQGYCVEVHTGIYNIHTKFRGNQLPGSKAETDLHTLGLDF
jgi:hypothetical protein